MVIRGVQKNSTIQQLEPSRPENRELGSVELPIQPTPNDYLNKYHSIAAYLIKKFVYCRSFRHLHVPYFWLSNKRMDKGSDIQTYIGNKYFIY